MGEDFFHTTLELDNGIDEMKMTGGVLDAVVTPYVGEGHIAVGVPETIIGELETSLLEPSRDLLCRRLLVGLDKRLLKGKTDTTTDGILADT